MSKFQALLDTIYEQTGLENPDYAGATPAQEHAVKHFVKNGKCKLIKHQPDGVVLKYQHNGDSGHLKVSPEGYVSVERDPAINNDQSITKTKKTADEDDEGSTVNAFSPVTQNKGLTQKDIELVNSLSGGAVNPSTSNIKNKVQQIQQNYGKVIDTLGKKADQQLKDMQST